MQPDPNNPNNPNNPYGATAYGGGYPAPAGNNDPYSQSDSSGVEPTVLASHSRYNNPATPAQPAEQAGYPYGPPSQPQPPQQGYFPPQQPSSPQQGYFPPQQPSAPQSGYFPQQPSSQPQQGYFPPQQPSAPQQGYFPPQQPSQPQPGYFSQQGPGQYLPPQQPGAPAPKRSGGSRTLLIVLAVLVVLLGLGAAIGIPVKVNRDNGNATATATSNNATVTAKNAIAQAQAKAATATVQAQAQATATAVANTYPFSAEQVINDPMSDNNGGYGWQTNDLCGFANGSYRVAYSQPTAYLDCVAKDTKFSNFTYQVDAQLLKGYALGITFRENFDARQYYSFVIEKAGSYAVFYKGGKDLDLQVMKEGEIGVDLAQVNQIAVVARGDTMTIYMNQKKVTTFTSSALSEGQIGVYAFSDKSAVLEAVFSNAKVWKLQ